MSEIKIEKSEKNSYSKNVINKHNTKFETHPKRESLMADLSNTQKFNPFSKDSKDLISNMGNTEYFELRDFFQIVH